MRLDWLRRMLGPCEACEILKETLALERARVKELMTLMYPARPSDIPTVPESIRQEVPKQSYIPWKVKQQMLEREDRERAKILKEFKTTEELEKEVGIS